MKKEDTINAYLDKFLEGRSEESRKEFLSRGIDRQYASIMAWKHRQYGSDKEMHDLENIIDALRTVRRSLPAVADLTSKDIKRLRKETSLIEAAISEYERQQRAREIKELEEQQRQLVKRLAQLRDQESR